MDMLNFGKMQESPFEKGRIPELLSLCHVCKNPEWIYQYHVHDGHTELIYIASGKATYTLDRVPLSVKAGDIIVINQGVFHLIESDHDDPVDSWTCSISGIALSGLPEGHLIPSNVYPLASSGYDGNWILSTMQAIQAQHKRYGSTAVCTPFTLALCMLAVQIFYRAPAITGKQKESIAPEIMNYISKHFGEPITLQRLSEVFHISQSQISHEVRRMYGVSPINSLIDRRMCEAKWLLITTKDAISHIASAVGYENADHFSNLFCKRIGMRPLDYREKFASFSEPKPFGF